MDPWNLPPQELPFSLSTPHQMDPRSVESTAVRMGFEENYRESSERPRFDHSLAETLKETIWYPLGRHDTVFRFGFRDQTIVRNFLRAEDVFDLFVDCKCPFVECKKAYAKNTSHTRLRKHLAKKHWDELSHTLIPTASQREFEHDLMALAESNKISTLFFDDPTWHNFVLKYTSMTPISSKTVMRRAEDLTDDCIKEIKMLLGSASSRQYFLTMDEWSSANQGSFLGLLASMIAPESKRSESQAKDLVRWQVKRRLIAYAPVEKGDAPGLASVISVALNSVGLAENDIVGFISDNCNLMRSLSKHMTRLRIPCLAHLIQSAIETLWTPKSGVATDQKAWVLMDIRYAVFQLTIRDIIARVRELFGWIKASSVQRQKLEHLQLNNGQTSPLGVHMDVVTRWDSVRQMIGRYVALEMYLVTMHRRYCEDKKLPDKPLFTDTEFRLLTSLHCTMNHASCAQESLCEEGPTISRTLPTMYRLATTLQRIRESHPIDLKDVRLAVTPKASKMTFSHYNPRSLHFKNPAVTSLLATTHVLLQNGAGLLNPVQVRPAFCPLLPLVDSSARFLDVNWSAKSHDCPYDALAGDTDPFLTFFSQAVFDGVLSDILMIALEAYWPYFDLAARFKMIGPVSGTSEPEDVSEKRSLLFVYATSALLNPSNLDFKWVDPIIHWKHGKSPTDRQSMAAANKKALQDIFRLEFEKLYVLLFFAFADNISSQPPPCIDF